MGLSTSDKWHCQRSLLANNIPYVWYILLHRYWEARSLDAPSTERPPCMMRIP